MRTLIHLNKISRPLLAILALASALFGLLLIYQIPSVNDRLYWRIEVVKAEVLSRIAPRAEYVPAPRAAIDPNVRILLPTAPPLSAGTVAENASLPPAEAIPDRVLLPDTTHIWQHWNNCGPATLTMALNYWGWPGTQANAAASLKPNRLDPNVSPEELAAYAEQVGYKAVTRPGGTPALLRRLVAAGFPVMIERELLLEKEGWAGHYALVIGYDKPAATFVTQDTFQGPNLTISEARLNEIWLPFNYQYLVAFPADREGDVLKSLGPEADPLAAYNQAAQRALVDIPALSGIRQGMAYYNLGLSLQALGDSAAAVTAFDQARLLNIPYRMLWYQPNIYAAYYAQGRYTEVLTLADFTLSSTTNSEEAYYWRGKARQALGDRSPAIQDYKTSTTLNPNYRPPADALASLGVSP